MNVKVIASESSSPHAPDLNADGVSVSGSETLQDFRMG
jgi:hypothetical protein